MKTIEQILSKYNESHSQVTNELGFCYTDLLQFIPWELVQDYLKPETTKEEWNEYYRPLTKGNVIGVMEQNIKLAWEKCLDESLLSCRRNIAHYSAWLWILEDKELLDFIEDKKNYARFGAPILNAICKKFNWVLEDIIEVWQFDKAQLYIEGEGC